MSERIDTFLAEVRNMPGFVTASATDPKWFDMLESIERAPQYCRSAGRQQPCNARCTRQDPRRYQPHRSFVEGTVA